MKMLKNMPKPMLVKHKLLCTTNVSHKFTVLGNSHYYSNKSKGTIQINSQVRPIMLYTLLFFRLYDFHYFIGICLLLYAIFFRFSNIFSFQIRRMTLNLLSVLNSFIYLDERYLSNVIQDTKHKTTDFFIILHF